MASALTSLLVLLGTSGRAGAQQAETVRDAANARVVLVVVIGLILLGVVLAAVTVWFWRATRPDHPVLVRLEVLSGRRARNLSSSERQELLDSVAPRSSTTASSPTIPSPSAVPSNGGGSATPLISRVLGTPQEGPANAPAQAATTPSEPASSGGQPVP